jgi:hypothetical protein
MFREFLFPLRCAAIANWIQNSLVLLMAMLMNGIRGIEHDHEQERQLPIERLHPQSAVERAILNRFAHMLG